MRRLLVVLSVACTLVAAVGVTQAGTAPLPNLLICATNTTSYDLDVRSKLVATGLYSAVDLLDCGSTTPSLVQLQAYTSVIAYSDNDFADANALGDNLADYVDGGGHVVIAVFAFNPVLLDLGIGGRLASGGYLPFSQGGQSQNGPHTLVADLPGSSLLAGVSSFNGGSFSYRNPGATLTSGATLVAHWDDGVPLIAFKGGVVGLNFYPPSSDARPGFWDATTDGARLMTNAAGGGSSTPSTTSAKPRGGYCAVAGNTHPYTHIPFRPGTFINLTEGQEGLDSYYKGAVPANYLQGLGITCDTPAGYVKTDMKVGYFGAGDPGIYTYYKKAA